MGFLEWLMPPSIFNVHQTRLLENGQGAQLEPDFRPALLVVDMQEDFCPPVSLSGSASCTYLYRTRTQHRSLVFFCDVFHPS